jgi:hypothetical protein
MNKVDHTHIPRKVKLRVKDESNKNNIDFHIDKLYEYSASYQMICRMRSFIGAPNSAVKKHFKEDLCEFKIIKDINTNYGRINITTTRPVASHSGNIIYEALVNLEHDPSDLELNYDSDISPEFKYNLIINVTEIKNDTNVLNELNNYLEQLNKLVTNCEVEDSSLDEKTLNIIKQISSRKKLAKELMKKGKAYLVNYNRMRDLFKQCSTEGNFVRTYNHRGAYLTWDEDLTSLSFSNYVIQIWLPNYDETNNTNEKEKFAIECRKIYIKQNKFTIKVTLDNYDYLADE